MGRRCLRWARDQFLASTDDPCSWGKIIIPERFFSQVYGCLMFVWCLFDVCLMFVCTCMYVHVCIMIHVSLMYCIFDVLHIFPWPTISLDLWTFEAPIQMVGFFRPWRPVWKLWLLMVPWLNGTGTDEMSLNTSDSITEVPGKEDVWRYHSSLDFHEFHCMSQTWEPQTLDVWD